MIMLNTYAHEWPDALDRTRTLVDEARGRPGRGQLSRADQSSATASRSTQGQIPWGFSSRMPWAASAPALVALPLRMYSKPTAIIAPMIGPTR